MLEICSLVLGGALVSIGPCPLLLGSYYVHVHLVKMPGTKWRPVLLNGLPRGASWCCSLVLSFFLFLIPYVSFIFIFSFNWFLFIFAYLYLYPAKQRLYILYWYTLEILQLLLILMHLWLKNIASSHPHKLFPDK